MLSVGLSNKTYRIVPSVYPPIQLFESCTDPEDLEALYELESLTNPRLQEEIGVLSRVPPSDRLSGPGSSPIMAAFTHCGVASRFTDGRYGVYYAGLELDTSIAETKYWQEKLLSSSNEPPMYRDMRVYVAHLQDKVGELVDVRAMEDLHETDNYAASQALADTLRLQNEYGVLYNSVRRLGGLCVAIFRPPILAPVMQTKHLRYHWNGERIDRVDEITNIAI